MWSILWIGATEAQRQLLCRSAQWEQAGCELVGVAHTETEAIIRIQQLLPHIILLDLDAPRIDGLSLGALIRREFPNCILVLLTESREFSIAQKAVEIGAARLLQKPLSPAAFLETLQQLEMQRTHIDGNPKVWDQYDPFNLNGNRFQKRRFFFEEMFTEMTSMAELEKKAEALHIDFQSPLYNVVILMFPMDRKRPAVEVRPIYRQLIKDLMECLDYYPEYIPFPFHTLSYAVIVKGDAQTLEYHTTQCIKMITYRCTMLSDRMEWYVGVGEPTKKVEDLRYSLMGAVRAAFRRYEMPGIRVFFYQELPQSENISEKQPLTENIDSSLLTPKNWKLLLENTGSEEVQPAVEKWLNSIGPAVEHPAIRQYLAMTAMLCSRQYAEQWGSDYWRPFDLLADNVRIFQFDTVQGLVKYLSDLLYRMIEVRDGQTEVTTSHMLQRVLQYIEEHYTEYDLSVSRIADVVGVTPNYLSAVFKQNSEKSITEYINEKRMLCARGLLRTTQKRVQQIALEAGYRDPRYFSTLFKKMQGCTPKQYRETTSPKEDAT